MNKQYLLALFLCCFSLQGYHRARANQVVKKSYSFPALGLSIKQRSEIEELIYHILKSSNYEQAQAAQQVVALMDKELDHKKTMFDNAHSSNKAIMHHNAGILMAQKRHFENFSRVALHHLSWSDYLKGSLNNLWQKTRCFLSLLSNTDCSTQIQFLVEHLDAYCRLEREYIFANHTQTKHLLAAQRNNDIPQLMRIWTHPHAQFALINGVKEFAAKPQLQAAEALDIAVVAGGEAAGAATEAAAATLLEGGATVIGATAEEAAELTALFEELDAATAQLSNTMEALDALAPEFEEAATQAASVASSTIGESIGAAQDIAPEIAAELTEKLTGQTAAQAATDMASEGGQVAESLADQAAEEESIDEALKELDQIQEQIVSDVRQMDKQSYLQSLKEDLQNRLGTLSDNSVAPDLAKQQLKQLLKHADTLEDIGESALSEGTAKDIFLDELNTLKSAATDALKKATTQARMATALHMAFDMAVQMDIMMGSQLAVNWVNVEDAKEYAELSKERNTIAANFQANISKMSAARDAKINQLRSNFTAQVLKITNSQKNLIGINSSQKNYLMQSLVNASLNQLYVSPSVMQLDQYFYYAPMFTPNIPQKPLFSVNDITSQSQWDLPTKKPAVVKKDNGIWMLSNPAPYMPQNSFNWNLGPQSNTPAANVLANKPAPSGAPVTVPNAFPDNAMPHTWYNIFRYGNWQFDYMTGSFYQYNAVPFTSTQYPLGDPQQALYNSIFTDYIPPIILNANGIPTYIIQAELQIYSAMYPCFAGIMFNSGRWISGVTDLYHQHRLFGINGTPDKTLQIVAAETFYMDPDKKLKGLGAVWPLSQILADKTQKAVWAGLDQNLIINPLYPVDPTKDQPLQVGKTYILTIATQPSKIMLQVDEKTKDGNAKVFGPYTIENRNPFVFIYHNIGFISAGCSARFTLLQPKQLVYDAAMLKSFGDSLTSSKEPS